MMIIIMTVTTTVIIEKFANGYLRSLKVIHCCANQRGIYDFLLALSSNLTSYLQPFLRYHA